MSEQGHIGFLGVSGSGKTSLTGWSAIYEADRGWDCSSGIGFFLPHPDEGYKLILHLIDRGHGNRLLVRDMNRTDVVLPTTLIRRSDSADYWTRRQENSTYRDVFLDLAWRRRGEQVRLSERPTIEQASSIAVSVYQSLDQWLSPAQIPNFLVKGHPMQFWAVDHCTDEEARAGLRRMMDWNSHDQISLALPTERMLRGFFRSSAVEAMCSVAPTVDAPDWMRQGGIYICLGGGGREAIKTLMGAEIQQIIADAHERPCDIPRYLYVDEVVNYDLVGRL